MKRHFLIVYTQATRSELSAATNLLSDDLRHVYAYQCHDEYSIRIDYNQHGIARLNLTHAIDLEKLQDKTLAQGVELMQHIEVAKPTRRERWFHGFGVSTCADFVRQACGVEMRPVLTPRGLYNNLLKHDKIRNYTIKETNYGRWKS